MELKEFMELCKEFIEAEKKISKNIKYTETADLSYLYRFISSSTDAWKIINEWKKDGKI